MLRFHITVTNLDGIKFIRADTPVLKLLPASLGIKEPLSSSLHQRNGEGPLFIPDNKECAGTGFRIHGHRIFLARLSDEVGSVLPILRIFAAEDHILQMRTEDMCEFRNIELSRSINERGCSCLRCGETLTNFG